MRPERSPRDVNRTQGGQEECAIPVQNSDLSLKNKDGFLWKGERGVVNVSLVTNCNIYFLNIE